MVAQSDVNITLRYILFFCVIYILTCFIDRILVYYWLFIIFFLAIICKIVFYSNAQTIAKLCWFYIGICILCLFADQIKGEKKNFNSEFFKFILGGCAQLGGVIKSIFTSSLCTYTFLFMVVSTVYASLISNGKTSIIIIGWFVGIFLGAMVWIFLDGKSSINN